MRAVVQHGRFAVDQRVLNTLVPCRCLQFTFAGLSKDSNNVKGFAKDLTADLQFGCARWKSRSAHILQVFQETLVVDVCFVNEVTWWIRQFLSGWKDVSALPANQVQVD